jgi:predicted Zn-dependent protease
MVQSSYSPFLLSITPETRSHMKLPRNLHWILLGETLFLSLNLFLPQTAPFFQEPSNQAVAASGKEIPVKANKHLSLKTHPTQTDPTKSDKALSQSAKPTVAQRTILEEGGTLERGDAQLPDDGSLYDVYTFEGRANQSVSIRLESGDFDVYLILLDPDDRKVAENDDASRDDSNASLTATLPKNGTYKIIVNSYDARGRGRYTLAVSDATAAPTAREKTKPGDSQETSGGTVSLSEDEQILAQADRLYLQGKTTEAERLYRQVKPPFANERSGSTGRTQGDLITDPQQLSPAAQVYWRNVQDGLANDRDIQVREALELLRTEAPNFLPAQAMSAETLLEQGNTEQALAVLEEATTRMPNSAEFARLRVRALAEAKRPLEASIAARQFAIFNPDAPEVEEFTDLADEYLGDFRGKLREKIALRGLGGLAVGVLTGNTRSSVVQGVQLAQLMMTGESGLGSQVAQQVKRESDMADDAVVVDYVNELGQELARYMGRDEFEYEFYVIKDDAINAFALPGGKVFVNTGAIEAANSEAELAGLLAHELSHAVLSHGFERIVTNNLLANLSREIPLGNLLGTLVSLDYSRSQERQSDLLGTRVLNSAGYAADGLRNLMVTLGEERGSSPPTFLSSHPAPPDRIRYLESLIIDNGYNRYSFEGVEELAQIKARL